MVSMRKYLGVDPGKATGLSMLVDDPLAKGYKGVLYEYVCKDLETLWRILKGGTPDVLIVEDILGSRNFTQRLVEAAEVIGVCRLYAQQMGIPLVKSNPANLQGRHTQRPKGLNPHKWSARVHAMVYIENEEAARESNPEQK